jgi:replicative DNA helicase
MTEIEIMAERNALGALVKSPERFFSSTAIMATHDFADQTCRCIYRGIKVVFESDPGGEGAIDPAVLEHRIATDAPEYYARSATEIRETIDYILEIPELKERDFKESIRAVVKNSVLRRATEKLDMVKQNIPGCKTHEDILATMEKEVCGFTTQAVTRTDIVVMGSEYERYALKREQEAIGGNLHIGISTGFKTWDVAIGGGMRDGTMHIVAARSKMGKSWLALSVADNAAALGIPVLYLDTELEDNYQCDRRIAQKCRIPMHVIERALYLRDAGMKSKFQEAIKLFNKHPIMYVDVKGWSIDRIISAIRKFYAQYVGKKTGGEYDQGLVVYDYLKLMRSIDKGHDKEYEALGYRMTLLHDLMGEYNNPMLAPVQQNRDGLDKQDESTVSGSDRIIHLCDSASFLSAMSDSEIMARHAEVAGFTDDVPVPTPGGSVSMQKRVVWNMKFNVAVCRQGPGTPGDSYIATYADFKDRNIDYRNVCGHIEMGHLCRVVKDEGHKAGAGGNQHAAQSKSGGAT